VPALVATALAAFAIACAIQRRSLFALRWEPNRHTWAAVGAAALPAIFSALALLAPSGSLAFEVLLWLFIFGLCGFAIPWGYVLLVEKRDASALGVTRRAWALSLSLSLLFAAGSVLAMLRRVDVTRFPLGHVLGAVVHLNVGGLFELFLYCGFLHLRLRDAFGPLPAIVGSAALYSLWHVGTELPLHPEPLHALGMLFVVGLLCQALFATTYNLLVIWPFFFTAGVMHDFIVNLGLPDSIGTSLGWPLVGWGLALGIPTAVWLRARSQRNQASDSGSGASASTGRPPRSA
jgi:membrane protease YdiL (CAAX protease family)